MDEVSLRLRFQIRRQSGDFLFGYKVAVYIEVMNPVQKGFALITNPDIYESIKESARFLSRRLRLWRNLSRFLE